MINFDAARPLPTGSAGWQELLSAISESDATDETLWVEHKAGLDPASKSGGAALAKAIVAFGNREVAVAARYLGGHAIILVGMEPGQTPGVTAIDPARLRDTVDRFLASPAPGWDSSHHTFQGQTVLVVIVDPPRDGDPIFVLGKAGGDPKEGIRDGAIYVRRPGKSELATSDDIRKLEARRDAGRVVAPVLDLSVEPASAEYTIPWLDDYDSTWVDRYVETEQLRLLESLEPAPRVPARGTGIYGSVMMDALRSFDRQIDMFGTRREETRTKDEFRAEVEAWAAKARTTLPAFLEDLRQHYARPLIVSVVNNTQRNYASLRVELHIAGPVWGYEEHLAKPRELKDLAGRPPRKWGPWTDSRLPVFQAMEGLSIAPIGRIGPLRPFSHQRTATVRATGKGHTIVSFPTFDLRPGHRTTLEEVFLIADSPFASTTTVNWVATATNVDALADGEFTLQIAANPAHLDDVTSDDV